MFLFHLTVIILLALIISAVHYWPILHIAGFTINTCWESWAIIRVGAYDTFLMGLDCIDVQMEIIVKDLFLLGSIIAYFV